MDEVFLGPEAYNMWGGGGRQGEERKSVLESPTELRLAKEHFTGVSQLLASLGT